MSRPLNLLEERVVRSLFDDDSVKEWQVDGENIVKPDVESDFTIVCSLIELAQMLDDVLGPLELPHSAEFNDVWVVNHPMVKDSLGHLRNGSKEIQAFRHHSDKIVEYLFAAATRGLSLRDVTVQTPLQETSTQKLKDSVVVVPVLRSGLTMLTAAMKALPKSKIGMFGLARNENTFIAEEYYVKMPQRECIEGSVVVITDPMLATGGSAYHVIEHMMEYNPKEIILVCVVTAPEGIRKIKEKFPEVTIVTAAIDNGLNGDNFIIPGLGDYGDRYFGT
ncbi:MAG: uracil phosphoribosyltransferase [Patescibacteria group bacterium]